MTRLLILLSLPLIFWLLPVRLAPRGLMMLAFALWLIGGLFLAARGLYWVSSFPSWLPYAVLVGATAIGYAKGKFVLSKSSRKNIERLEALGTPQKLIQVYSTRSWIIIGLMMGLALLLNVLDVGLLVRGGVNVAVGLALIASSFAYVKALKTTRHSAAA